MASSLVAHINALTMPKIKPIKELKMMGVATIAKMQL
jgi:hypothetical protein